MNHPVIETFIELERRAAMEWWSLEDRTSWRDDLLRRKDTQQVLSLKSCLKTDLTVSTIAVWDPDLRRCFSVLATETDIDPFSAAIARLMTLSSEELFGLALRPGYWLSEEWSEEEESLRRALTHAQNQGAVVFRSGFFTEQADILMTAELGFSGVQIHVADLDLFQLQLLLELSRDCRLSPIISVENEEQLDIVLQTDAPHIALCYLPGSKNDQGIRFLQKALPLIPRNCTRMLLSGSQNPDNLQMLRHLGIQCILAFS